MYIACREGRDQRCRPVAQAGAARGGTARLGAWAGQQLVAATVPGIHPSLRVGGNVLAPCRAVQRYAGLEAFCLRVVSPAPAPPLPLAERHAHPPPSAPRWTWPPARCRSCAPPPPSTTWCGWCWAPPASWWSRPRASRLAPGWPSCTRYAGGGGEPDGRVGRLALEAGCEE